MFLYENAVFYVSKRECVFLTWPLYASKIEINVALRCQESLNRSSFFLQNTKTQQRKTH